MEQTTRHPQGNCEVWVRYTAYPKECHEWAVSRFGNEPGCAMRLPISGRNVFRHV